MRPALSRGWPAPGASSHPHAPTHEADGPAGRVPAGECDGRGSRGPRGRCIRHAPEATPRAVGPLVVPVIEPAFRAALMPRVRALPLAPLRGRAAGLPTVGLPPPAGPTDGEHRRAPRPAAPHRAPQPGSGAHAGPPRRRRRVRRRWETRRTAGGDGGANPCGLRSRAQGSRRCRDRTRSRPTGRARVGVKSAARAGGASGHGGRRIPCLPGAHGAGVRSLHRGAAGPDPSRSRPGVAGFGARRGDRGDDTAGVSMAIENCTRLAAEHCTRWGQTSRAERTFSGGRAATLRGRRSRRAVPQNPDQPRRHRPPPPGQAGQCFPSSYDRSGCGRAPTAARRHPSAPLPPAHAWRRSTRTPAPPHPTAPPAPPGELAPRRRPPRAGFPPSPHAVAPRRVACARRLYLRLGARAALRKETSHTEH